MSFTDEDILEEIVASGAKHVELLLANRGWLIRTPYAAMTTEQKEDVKRRVREWRALNPAYVREYRRDYYAANVERHRKYRTDYYARNREKVLAKSNARHRRIMLRDRLRKWVLCALLVDAVRKAAA